MANPHTFHNPILCFVFVSLSSLPLSIVRSPSSLFLSSLLLVLLSLSVFGFVCLFALRGGRCSLVAYLSLLTIDHASLSRRSTVLTPNRDLQHLCAHFFFLSVYCMPVLIGTFAYLLAFLFRRLWLPYISWDGDRFLATI